MQLPWNGGTGNDVYFVDNAADFVNDSGGNADEVVIGVNFTVPNQQFQLYAGIEIVRVVDTNALVLVTGNELDNIFTGGNKNDVLSGAAGIDHLVGLGGRDTLDGGIGADTMVGGSGGDIYYVDDAGDQVIEQTGDSPASAIASGFEGPLHSSTFEDLFDSVFAAIDYTLTDFVENLTLSGTADSGTGNLEHNTISGNTRANTLDGAVGNDTITGGDGNDTLIGGTGNDNLNGGVDTDTARFNGNANQYTVIATATGYTVTGLDGTDTSPA